MKQNGTSLKYASEELKNEKSLGFAVEESHLSSGIMVVKEEEDFLVQFLSQEKNSTVSREMLWTLENLIYLFIKRSDLYYSVKQWNCCISDSIIYCQLANLAERTSNPERADKSDVQTDLMDFKERFGIDLIESTKEEIEPTWSETEPTWSPLKSYSYDFIDIQRKIRRNVKKIVEHQCHDKMLPDVEKQRILMKDFSWMEFAESKLKEDRVFVNEWNDDKLFTKMKKAIMDHARNQVSESLPIILHRYEKNIRAISEKYIRCKFEYSEYIHEETKKEFEDILDSILSPLSQFSRVTKDIGQMKLSYFGGPRETKGLKGLECFGFVDKNSTIHGYGLEYGEFSVGGGFGRKSTTIYRRLFYGTFDRDGMRHGHKCIEYSRKDGSKVYEGGFKNGKREGKGIEYSVDKKSGIPIQVFEGIFRNGRRNGRGEEFDPMKGLVVRGTWRNGELDESTIFKFECPIIKYSSIQRHLIDSQKVGKGAFGVIYKVKKSSIFKGIKSNNEKFVAVKILDKASSSMEQAIMVRMIRRGIGFCYSVKSKHILESYGIVVGNGEIGYVMKLCEKSIDKVIEERKSTLEEKIRILKGTALGVKALHDQFLIHRDLKWGNVLMDFDGLVKITDFDTVKEEELQWRLKALSQSARVGTPGFRPPEVITGKKYTFKCDIYAFGLMIYSLLFEKNFPYINRFQCSCGDKMTDILRNDRLEEHIANCCLRPLMNPDEVKKFPSFLIDLMVQCWDKNPFNRPSNLKTFFSCSNFKKIEKYTKYLFNFQVILVYAIRRSF